MSSVIRQLEVGRRLALIFAALACVFAFAGAMATVDASAASVQDVRPSSGAASRNLDMPKIAPLRSGRANSARTVGFRNSYGKTVNVAIMRYDPARCGAYGNWRTEGWWVLAPGEEKRAMTTSNDYAAFYAEAIDGTKWSGDRGPVYIYNHVFDSCIGIGSTAASAVVNMRLIDLRFSKPYSYINLIP